MNTRYLLGAILACTVGALSAVNGVHAQAPARAPAHPPANAPANVPIAGEAVLGVTIAEEKLIATGFRASKLLKQEVYNDKGQKIGKIDDFVITPDGRLSVAVIDVGGFLGIGGRRVAVPVRQFAQLAPKPILPNASKDALKARPPFHYT